MINFNGTLQDNSALYIETNRGFLFGDAVFETVKIVNSKIVFLEEHYLRLMASMRICRMEIPMLLTMEYFEEQIVSLLQALKFVNARVRFTVFRDSEGYYTPNSNDVKFVIMANELNNTFYSFSNEPYEVELFKDFHLGKHLLSTIKTNNKMIHTLAGIFAKENDYQNCLLINEDKNIVEAIQANIFMKMGDVISTPPISEGCQNGILRKQIIKLISKNTNIKFEEKPISPFDLQKADELFLTNVIIGIQPITKYRKKMYVNDFATQLLKELNCLLN